MSTRKRDAFGTGETTEAKADAERDATDVRIRELEAAYESMTRNAFEAVARAEKAEARVAELEESLRIRLESLVEMRKGHEREAD